MHSAGSSESAESDCELGASASGECVHRSGMDVELPELSEAVC